MFIRILQLYTQVYISVILNVPILNISIYWIRPISRPFTLPKIVYRDSNPYIPIGAIVVFTVI